MLNIGIICNFSYPTLHYGVVLYTRFYPSADELYGVHMYNRTSPANVMKIRLFVRTSNLWYAAALPRKKLPDVNKSVWLFYLKIMECRTFLIKFYKFPDWKIQRVCLRSDCYLLSFSAGMKVEKNPPKNTAIIYILNITPMIIPNAYIKYKIL